MSTRAGALAIGLVIVGLATVFYTSSVNRDLAHLHRRLDQHERLIATIAALMPVITPLRREERPQQEDVR